MKDLLQEIAEKIAGKYHTPSEGTYDQAREIFKLVAEALRDEIVEDGNCLYCVATTKMYNEILASDGVEAAGVSASEEPIRTVVGGVKSDPRDKTPAAAPDVCVWTFEGGKLFSAQCGGGWWRIEDYQRCPSCERPIKRKSEAAR